MRLFLLFFYTFFIQSRLDWRVYYCFPFIVCFSLIAVFVFTAGFSFSRSSFKLDSFVIGTDTISECVRPIIVTATIEDSAPAMTSSNATLDDVLASLLGLAPVSPYQTMRRPISQPVMNRNQQQEHERLKQTNSERSKSNQTIGNDIRSASNFSASSR